MAGTLREELASLKIDRPEPDFARSNGHRNPTRRRRRGGWLLRLLSWLLWMVPLGLLGAGGAYAYREYDQIRSQPQVTVALVQQMTTGEANKLLSAKGYLKSRFQALIGTKIPGRVEKMCVEEGQKVKKGDTLAILEHNELKAMLASRQAQLIRTQAELEEAKADLWEKERENRRVSRLFAQKSVTAEESEKAQSAFKKATARVAAVEAGVKLVKSNIDEISATIRTMFLYAPFDGTVVEKQGEEGEVIATMAMSSTLGRTAVVTIADLQTMDVETDISEGLLSRVDLGQPAEVSVSAIPSRRYQGRLRQVIPMGDRTRGTVKVKVEIVDPDAKLFPELAATVHFLPNKTDMGRSGGRSFVYVNKSAVFSENGHDFVWVVGSKNVIQKRAVEVATTTDVLGRVESGLKPGDTVVLNPLKALRDNETVRIAD